MKTKTAKDWLSERPLAEANQERWVQRIMDASRLNLTSDDIFTLKLQLDFLPAPWEGNSAGPESAGRMPSQQRLKLKEVIEKIIRQCEGQKFEGE